MGLFRGAAPTEGAVSAADSPLQQQVHNLYSNPANVPRHKIAVWLNHRLAQPVLSLGLGVRHNSKVPDATNLVWVPAVTLADARLGHAFGRWEVALNARSLLDKDYLATCGGGLCYPGNRRELLGTTTYRW